MIYSILFLVLFVPADTEPEKLAQKFIQENDLDKDGVICLQEAKNEILKEFNDVDTNTDKYLSLEELTYYYQQKLK